MRLAIALLVVLLQGAAHGAGQPTFQEIEESLTCQCGCGLTVHSCNHLQCGSALPLRQEIREQMALGLDKEQILAHFQQRYGEKILSSPTTHGFNLTAWTTPFVALAAGTLFVVVTLRRWRRAGTRAPAGPRPTTPPRSGELTAEERLLERELERFDG